MEKIVGAAIAIGIALWVFYGDFFKQKPYDSAKWSDDYAYRYAQADISPMRSSVGSGG